MVEKTMEKIVALAKNRGFVYPGSEIYGGLANTWDYGPIGKKLKNNVDIDLSINVKDKKLVASIENLLMRIEDSNWLLPTRKINYCPMCRQKAR